MLTYIQRLKFAEIREQGYLENGHRVWGRTHASWHVQRHGSYEERVALELCASSRQSFQVEHFPYVDVDVSKQIDM